MSHPISPETRAKLNACAHVRQGKPLTSEHRAKLSAMRQLPEARAKNSAARLGKPLSPEHRAKIAAAMKRPETRAALRATSIGNTRARDASIKGECVYCGAPAKTLDHVIPRGRPGWEDDVVPACEPCNKSKQDRTPDEWLAEGLYSRGIK